MDVRPLLVVSVLAATTPGCAVVAIAAAVIRPHYDAGDLARNSSARDHGLATVGCLEVAASVGLVDHRLYMGWRMGNRCNEPVGTDLRAIDVEAIDALGRTWRIGPLDPRDEIEPRPLAARRLAVENFGLDDATWADALDVDVDASRLTPAGRGKPVIRFRFRKVGASWVLEEGSGT